MSKVVLHLGLAKTGTSWLQQNVFPLLPLEFVHCSKYDVLNKYNHDLLLSFEGFSGTIQCNDRFVNAYRLHRLFPSAKVLVVFREREGYLWSLYSQFIRGGGLWCFDEFKQWALGHPYFMDWLLYKKYLCRLFNKDCHGGNNCLFLDFKDLKTDPEGFVESICDFIDVRVPTGIDYTPVNMKLTEDQLERWRRWNKHFKSKWNKDALLPRYCNPCVIYDHLQKV